MQNFDPPMQLASSRRMSEYVGFFLLLLVAALGYSEFFSSYGRLNVLLFAAVLLKSFPHFKSKAGAEVFILWLLYLHLSLVLVSLYLDGALPAERIGYLLLFPLAVCGAYLVGKKLLYEELSIILCLFFLLLFAVGVYQLFSPGYISGQDKYGEWMVLEGIPWFARRVSALSGNANILGSLAVFVLLFNLFSPNRFVKYATTISTFLCIIFLAKSRSSFLMASLAVILYFIARKKYLPLSFFLLGGGALAYLVAPYVISDQTINTLLRFSDSDWGVASYDARVSVNIDAFNIWVDHYFLFGVGLDAENYALNKYDAFAPYTESIFVKIPLELGMIGTILLVLSALISSRRLWHMAVSNGLGNLFLIFTVIFLFMGIMETAPLMSSAMLPIAIIFGTITSAKGAFKGMKSSNAS